MTIRKLRLSLSGRGRRRMARRQEEPAEVFRTFVHVLAQMRAHARAGHASVAPVAEKN